MSDEQNDNLENVKKHDDGLLYVRGSHENVRENNGGQMNQENQNNQGGYDGSQPSRDNLEGRYQPQNVNSQYQNYGLDNASGHDSNYSQNQPDIQQPPVNYYADYSQGSQNLTNNQMSQMVGGVAVSGDRMNNQAPHQTNYNQSVPQKKSGGNPFVKQPLLIFGSIFGVLTLLLVGGFLIYSMLKNSPEPIEEEEQVGVEYEESRYGFFAVDHPKDVQIKTVSLGGGSTRSVFESAIDNNKYRVVILKIDYTGHNDSGLTLDDVIARLYADRQLSKTFSTCEDYKYYNNMFNYDYNEGLRKYATVNMACYSSSRDTNILYEERMYTVNEGQALLVGLSQDEGGEVPEEVVERILDGVKYTAEDREVVPNYDEGSDGKDAGVDNGLLGGES